MSRLFSQEVVLLLRELIHKITGFEENSFAAATIEKKITKQLQNADSMLFLSRKQVDDDIASLGDKFNFHGFCSQAEDLQKLYSKYMRNITDKDELNKRLNVIWFLMCLSERPTEKLVYYKKELTISDDEDEEINWSEYLREGIPKWAPQSEESSDWGGDSACSSPVSQLNQSEDSRLSTIMNAELSDIPSQTSILRTYVDTFERLKMKLKFKVQHTWFNLERVSMIPESNWCDANVAIDWEQFKDNQLYNLVNLPKSTIISEYKVIRETLWQFSKISSCVSYRFNEAGKLIVNPELTIASVRREEFQLFMGQFLQYIELLQTFRTFHDSVNVDIFEAEDQPPCTYRSYSATIQNSILHPIYVRISEIENRIGKQDTTETLVKLLDELNTLFRPVLILKKIHERVVLDWRDNLPLECAVTLLTKLHSGFLNSLDKTEQDMYLTLYLGSLYPYFAIIEKWLTQDFFTDYRAEFVIANVNPIVEQTCVAYSVRESPEYSILDSYTDQGEQDWQMEFFVLHLEEEEPDDLVDIIRTKVLNLGKNVHLLMLMDKLHLAYDAKNFPKETLYEEFVDTMLLKISEWHRDDSQEPEEAAEAVAQVSEDRLLIQWPSAKFVVKMDKLEKLLDTSDPSIMQTFDKYLRLKPRMKLEDKGSLFERVQNSSNNLFCGPDIIAKVFSDILNKRFTNPGVMVRNLLVNENKLEKQFEFLKHIYLFKDDFTFYFYRRIFQQMNANEAWGNNVWLTSHLQDLMMDAYPEFYQRCSVMVKENWKVCRDPLKACGLITVRYFVEWPLNIVIRTEHLDMYKEVFKFALKIKWVLYTLNHLCFDELNLKSNKASKTLKVLNHRLKLLRFKLLMIFNTMEHYVFGNLFHTYSEKFDSDFKSSSDMDSLISAHENFVKAVYNSCMELKNYKSDVLDFDLLVYLALKLRTMWKDSKNANEKELSFLEQSFATSFVNVNDFLISRYLFA